MERLDIIKNQCDAISKKIEKIGADNNSHYVIDGIIDLEKYFKAKYRVLWILKEVNSESDTWSYLENFKNKEWLYRCGKSVPTLKRIIYTTYAILRGCEWHEIPDASNEKSFEPLQEIALINIKKIPGGSVAQGADIQDAYYKNKDLLKEQIETYNPNVIIFGNTMGYFFKDDFEGLNEAEKQITDYGNHFYDTGNKLYIHTWHPAVRGKGFTDKDYVIDIASIVRNWSKE